MRLHVSIAEKLVDGGHGVGRWIGLSVKSMFCED